MSVTPRLARPVGCALRILAVAVIGLCLASSANAAIVIYSGVDPLAGSSDPRPSSDAAAAAFDAAVGSGLNIITFESAPLGNFGNLIVAPGVTATLTSTESNFGGGITNLDNTDLGYNTTLGGSKYVRLEPAFNTTGSLTFTFDKPIDAFGAYITGAEDFFGDVHVTFNDGSSQDFDLPFSGSGGGVQFWGFTDFGRSISSVTIESRSSIPGLRDLIGVDDVRFQQAPIPEPTTLALCGLIGVGLAGYRLRRRRVFA